VSIAVNSRRIISVKYVNCGTMIRRSGYTTVPTVEYVDSEKAWERIFNIAR
jgi:hypothetical protein